MSSNGLLDLSQVAIGQSVIICNIDDKELAIKLHEMGCVPGESIIVTNKAAFGGPLAVSVMGYKLGLRIEEAKKISVTILPQSN